MFIGIDLGTSSIKTILIDENQKVIGSVNRPLDLLNPKTGYYEQNPDSWYLATLKSFEELKSKFLKEFTATNAIGISGQMHGATLIDKNKTVLRPCILWNDTRSASQCIEMENSYEFFRKESGNIAMPGFTAPKILWIKQNEPDVFKKIYKILLPKDYLRFRLTDKYYSDMSDASGTLWLDVENRKWSEKLLSLTSVDISQMPLLVEGTSPTAYLSKEIKNKFGFQNNIIVAGGAGDQAAGAVGSGVINSQQSMISLGTSGVYFSPTSKFSSNTNQAVHSFCHCLPKTWHHMSVMLSATNCLNWISKMHNLQVGEAINIAKEFFTQNFTKKSIPFFLPYLSGERTPHNDSNIRGSLHMIDTSTDLESMIYAVIEGITFGIKDGFDAVHSVSNNNRDIYLVGGGSKSEFWSELISSALNEEIIVGQDSDLGPALGAARLAMLSTNKYKNEDVILNMKPLRKCCPSNKISEYLQDRYKKWKILADTSKSISRRMV